MKINLKEDLSKLTNLNTRYLDKMENYLEYIIIDGIQDSLIDNDNTTELTSDIGSILISVEGDNVRYKFVPSENFDNLIKTKLKYGQNLLKDKLDKLLVERITTCYKDLF